MKRFLISNPSLTENRSARITSSGGLTIVNTGVDGAWVTTEKRNDFCLAPRQTLSVGEQSIVEGLSLDGTFIIEVDGSVVPYSLTPDQLTNVFRPGNAYGIIVEKRIDGFFNIRNSVIKETEVRIFRSSATGNFIDNTGVFKALDILGVEFGARLCGLIPCTGAIDFAGVLTLNDEVTGTVSDAGGSTAFNNTAEMLTVLTSKGFTVVELEEWVNIPPISCTYYSSEQQLQAAVRDGEIHKKRIYSGFEIPTLTPEPIEALIDSIQGFNTYLSYESYASGIEQYPLGGLTYDVESVKQQLKLLIPDLINEIISRSDFTVYGSVSVNVYEDPSKLGLNGLDSVISELYKLPTNIYDGGEFKSFNNWISLDWYTLGSGDAKRYFVGISNMVGEMYVATQPQNYDSLRAVVEFCMAKLPGYTPQYLQITGNFSLSVKLIDPSTVPELVALPYFRDNGTTWAIDAPWVESIYEWEP